MINSSYTYYFLALIEGSLVMAYEVISARLLVPFYGSSIYTLTAILSVTLLSLLFGYYLGGVLSKSKKRKFLLVLFFILIPAILLIALPVTSTGILFYFLKFGLIQGSLSSTVVIMGLPLMLLGAVSPMIIEMMSAKLNAGKASGNVYAISTLGGVIATLLVGLYLVPEFGIKHASMIFGTISAVFCSLFLMIRAKQYFLIFPILFLTNYFSYSKDFLLSPNFQIPEYLSDGIMGRLEVLDNNGVRTLSNNGTIQSKINLTNYESLMDYTHAIGTMASFINKENRNSAALIGLAGGSIILELKQLGFRNVDAIDIDKRTEFVCDKFFGINPNSYNFIQDDGRHYFNVTEKKYDLIVVDVSAAEQQPYHLYTNEALKAYKEKLNDSGMIIFNILDFAKDEGVIVNNVADGLFHLGLNVRLLKDFVPVALLDQDDFTTHIHERLLIADIGNINYSYKDNERINPCCERKEYNYYLKTQFEKMSTIRQGTSYEGFMDDNPKMEKLSFKRIQLLRSEKFIK